MVGELVVLGATAYIGRFAFKAVRAGREGWVEGVAARPENLKQKYDERAAVYADLTREDWEGLGLSREWLTAHVGREQYARLMGSWYPPPVTNTAMDRYLARFAKRRNGVD